jgi:PAS domain S-box-containing protein
MSWAQEQPVVDTGQVEDGPAAGSVTGYSPTSTPAEGAMIGGFELLSFPDDAVLLELKREREAQARAEAERLLERASEELMDRWNELQAEVGVHVDMAPAQPVPDDRVHAVVRAAADAIISFDAAGRVLTCNPATERLFEAASADLIGSHLADWMPDFSLPPASSDAERACVEETRARSAQGREFTVEVAVRVVKADEGEFGAAVLRDITERKRYEAELQRLNASLQAQVEETQSALQKLRETQVQLVMAEKLASLGGLVAGIAHEINTPVGIAVTAASHLAERTAEFSSAADAGTLKRSQLAAYTQTCLQSSQIILGNLERAAQLVQSFKKVAVDQSTEDSRVVVFADYLHEVMTHLQPRLRASKVRVSLDCDPVLKLDTVPGAWSQILTNLVLNALDHAFPADTEGQVRVATRRHGGRLELRVIDNGAGIAPEVLPKVFDPFFTTRRGEGGSGLGLHVVFNLVHQTLGGTIRVESRLNEGAQFIVDCPAKWVES